MEDYTLPLKDISKHFDNKSYNSCDVADDANLSNDDVESSTTSKRYRGIIISWISMLLAVLSASSIGPMFKYMKYNGIQPLLAVIWRGQCMILFLVPLALIEFRRGNVVEWTARKAGLKYPLFVHVLFAGLGWTGNLLFWILGLMHTSTVRASMFASSYPLMLVVYLHFNGVVVSRVEWIGVLAAIIGIIILTGSTVSDSNELYLPLDRIYGDGLCLLSAVCETLVIVNRQKTRAYVPLMQYTAVTTVIVVFITSFLWILLDSMEGREIEILCLKSNCFFGWFSDFWILKIICFGLLIGVVCIAGFNYALQYLSPLVFSAITLVDPAITGIISWLVGIEGVPDVYTWSGGVVVIGGVLLVVFGENQRLKEEVAREIAFDDSDEVI